MNRYIFWACALYEYGVSSRFGPHTSIIKFLKKPPSYYLTVQKKKSEIHPVPDTSEEEAIPIDIFTSREYLKGQYVPSLGNKVICRCPDFTFQINKTVSTIMPQ